MIRLRPLALLLLALQACTPPPPPPPPGPPVPLSGSVGEATVVFAVAPRAVGRDGEPVDLQVLVPLACRDQSQINGGMACLGMIPEESTVGLEGGDKVTPRMRARPHCQGRAQRTEGLVLEESTHAGHAVWPPSAHGIITPVGRGKGCRGWCRFGRAGHPRVRMKPALRQRLLRAARRHGLESGRQALQLVQVVTVDLDGDGAAERLYSVAVPDDDTEEYDFSFSALFVEPGVKAGKSTSASKAPRLRLMLRRDTHAVVLRGTLDLDKDGRQELWLLLSPTAGAGDSWVIMARDRRSTEVIGSYICHGS